MESHRRSCPSKIWSECKRFLRRIESPTLVTLIAVLLFRILTLPGALEGASYYLKPNWNTANSIEMWTGAIFQCVTLVAARSIFTVVFSSDQPMRRHLVRDTLVVSFLDLVTAFVTSTATFCVLGNLAYQSERHISDVVGGGRTLAFVSHSEAVAKFTLVPRALTLVFLLLMVCLGLRNAVWVIGIASSVAYQDSPNWKGWMLTLLISLVGFISALVFISPVNLHVLDLTDYSGAGFVILVMMTIHAVVFWFWSRSSSQHHTTRFLSSNRQISA